ncbi:hypothetical protein EYF80_027462 [Liparis tanakae]|uniref:Uncharacterized protein n=1 Tax=Liparis tanakae TaxID=230148 RepID=A0A4Z2HAR5_9TELE|nr:hypothetical protein EYF80_027462 [Liparis tanakae]
MPSGPSSSMSSVVMIATAAPAFLFCSSLLVNLLPQKIQLQTNGLSPVCQRSSDKSRRPDGASCWAVPPGPKNFVLSPAGLDSSMSLKPRCRPPVIVRGTPCIWTPAVPIPAMLTVCTPDPGLIWAALSVRGDPLRETRPPLPIDVPPATGASVSCWGMAAPRPPCRETPPGSCSVCQGLSWGQLEGLNVLRLLLQLTLTLGLQLDLLHKLGHATKVYGYCGHNRSLGALQSLQLQWERLCMADLQWDRLIGCTCQDGLLVGWLEDSLGLARALGLDELDLLLYIPDGGCLSWADVDLLAICSLQVRDDLILDPAPSIGHVLNLDDLKLLLIGCNAVDPTKLLHLPDRKGAVI